MEENKNQQTVVDTEQLKAEASTTLNEVKATIKTVNLKDGTEETKGALIEMFKNPIHKIKDIAGTESFFKTAVILILVWTAAVFLKRVTGISNLGDFFKYNFLSNAFGVMKSVLTPALSILAMSVIVLVMNKKSKKSLITVISTVTAANIPVIVATVINLLTIISYDMYKLTSPISGLCSVISTLLLYFGIKDLYGEEDDSSFIKTFVIVEVIFCAAQLLFSFLGIYL